MHTTGAPHRDRSYEPEAVGVKQLLLFFLRQWHSNSDGLRHSAEALDVFGCGLTQEQHELNEAAKATA